MQHVEAVPVIPDQLEFLGQFQRCAMCTLDAQRATAEDDRRPFLACSSASLTLLGRLDSRLMSSPSHSTG